MYRDHDSLKYAVRVWRTKVLKDDAALEVEKMVHAFLPVGFHVKIEQKDAEVPGFPFAPHYTHQGIFEDSKVDGSDAHFYVQGYSREDVHCKLLGVILSGRGFFPFT